MSNLTDQEIISMVKQYNQDFNTLFGSGSVERIMRLLGCTILGCLIAASVYLRSYLGDIIPDNISYIVWIAGPCILFLTCLVYFTTKILVIEPCLYAFGKVSKGFKPFVPLDRWVRDFTVGTKCYRTIPIYEEDIFVSEFHDQSLRKCLDSGYAVRQLGDTAYGWYLKLTVRLGMVDPLCLQVSPSFTKELAEKIGSSKEGFLTIRNTPLYLVISLKDLEEQYLVFNHEVHRQGTISIVKSEETKINGVIDRTRVTRDEVDCII